MKFNIKNYPNFKIASYKKRNEKDLGDLLSENTETNVPLTLPAIINELNNSSLLNLPFEDEIPIVFEDFTWLGKLKTILKNFIAKQQGEDDFESSAAHYDRKTKSVHLFNGIIETKITDEKFKDSYSKLNDSISNKEFLINFFTLHEIGHAIHAKVVNNTSFNNLTDYFKEKSNNKLHREQSLIFYENFADMFASIALLTIDKNNKNLIDDLQFFSTFRKEIQQEKYYTFNNLDKVISDFKNNKLLFNKIDDIFKYINSNTNNELKIRLKETLNNILNSQQHNEQLGYLSSLFKIKGNSKTELFLFYRKKLIM